MHDAERADAGQHARCAADHQIGAPDVGPAALHGDAADTGPGPGEALVQRLLAECVFEAWGHDQEDVECLV